MADRADRSEGTAQVTSRARVLVTGGSGFIAEHCILRLLDDGYLVRATVRSLDREPDVRSALRTAGQDPGDALSFVTAELTSDSRWADALAGCDFVLHVASPLPHGAPDNEAEVIAPARDGTLRVLRAARDAGVRRVVLTRRSGPSGSVMGVPTTSSPSGTGRSSTGQASARTTRARPWPSAQPGISSQTRVVAWNSSYSTQWLCSDLS